MVNGSGGLKGDSGALPGNPSPSSPNEASAAQLARRWAICSSSGRSTRPPGHNGCRRRSMRSQMRLEASTLIAAPGPHVPQKHLSTVTWPRCRTLDADRRFLSPSPTLPHLRQTEGSIVAMAGDHPPLSGARRCRSRRPRSRPRSRSLPKRPFRGSGQHRGTRHARRRDGRATDGVGRSQ